MLTKMASAALVATAMIGAARAQTLPVNWSGFTVGAGVGSSFGATTGQAVSNIIFFGLGRPDPIGVLGSLGVGYNYQFSNGLVLGAVGDFGLLNASDTLNNPVGGWSLRAHNSWLATLRGKFGYATGPMLIYATGGLALARTEATFTEASPFFIGPFLPFGPSTTTTKSAIRPGWTLGAGVDYAVTAHVSVEAEYLYAHINNLSFAIAQPPFPNGNVNFSENINVFRLGVNYRF